MIRAFSLLALLASTAAQAQSYPSPTFQDVITATDPRFYGLTTGNSDQAPAINAAIAHVASIGGGTVNVPSGTYSLQSQVTVLPMVRLQCQQSASFGTLGTLQQIGGTMFNVTWGSGAGSSNTPADAAILLRTTSAIDKCGFSYPQQVYTATTPIEYGPTILAYETTSQQNFGTTATNNFCFNCYSFLDFRGSLSKTMANIRVEYNWGAPIAYGVRINLVSDWSTYGHNIFHNGAYDFGDASIWSHLPLWTAANGVAFEIGNSDWINLNDEQAWGYEFGVELLFNGTYSAKRGPVWVSHSQFDACLYACVGSNPATTDSSLVSLRVFNNTFTAFNGTTGAQSGPSGGIVLYMSGTSVPKSVMFSNNFIFGPTNSIVVGRGADMIISNNLYNPNAVSTIASSGSAFIINGGGTTLVMTNNVMAGFGSFYTSNIPFTNVVNTGNFTQ